MFQIAATVTQSGSLRIEGASCASQMDRATGWLDFAGP